MFLPFRDGLSIYDDFQVCVRMLCQAGDRSKNIICLLCVWRIRLHPTMYVCIYIYTLINTILKTISKWKLYIIYIYIYTFLGHIYSTVSWYVCLHVCTYVRIYVCKNKYLYISLFLFWNNSCAQLFAYIKFVFFAQHQKQVLWYSWSAVPICEHLRCCTAAHAYM